MKEMKQAITLTNRRNLSLIFSKSVGVPKERQTKKDLGRKNPRRPRKSLLSFVSK